VVALDLADLIGMKNQHPNRRTLQLEKASHRLNHHTVQHVSRTEREVGQRRVGRDRATVQL
jgi:hypothetical protein